VRELQSVAGASGPAFERGAADWRTARGHVLSHLDVVEGSGVA
jgi:hypothetical protein